MLRLREQHTLYRAQNQRQQQTLTTNAVLGKPANGALSVDVASIQPAVAPPARILLSDHTPGVQHIYATFLRQHGLDVLTVPGGDGIATVVMAYRYQPDLVITNLHKPGIDGHRLCTLLRRHPRTAAMPLVMVTTLDEHHAQVRTLADDYITKPFPVDRLLYSIVPLLALGQSAHARIVGRALSVPMVSYVHPITGFPGPHTLAIQIALLTGAGDWTATSFRVADFLSVLRSAGRDSTNELVLRLALVLRQAAQNIGGIDLAHLGFDTEVVAIGDHAVMHEFQRQVQRQFDAHPHHHYASNIALRSASGTAPLPHLGALWKKLAHRD